MATNFKTVHDVEQWKAEMLESVVDAFASQNQDEIQKSISVWRWSDTLPFPCAEQIRINGGCLNFEVNVDDFPVMFGIWYTFGEVRVGVRIPHDLLAKDSGALRVNDRISTAYDGKICSRIAVQPGGNFYDWIFKDGENGAAFASFETGALATRDKTTEIMIASRLSDILIHLYMSTLNIMIDTFGLKVTVSKIVKLEGLKTLSIDVRGDFEAFEYWVKRWAFIDKLSPKSDGLRTYVVSGDHQLKLPYGDIQIDGAWFSILNIEDISHA